MTSPDRPVTRVFVIDDHELVRRALTDILASCDDLELVGKAATIQEALREIPFTRPDVALIDLHLPDGDGVELCRTIGMDHPDVRCLMHSSSSNEKAVADAISAGAVGYVLKDASIHELVEAIRKVAAGQASLDPGVTANVLARMKRSSERPEKVNPLSPREQMVLDLISQGLTNREIASRLHLAEQTVKNQVSSLLGKLGVQSRTQAAVYSSQLTHDA